MKLPHQVVDTPVFMPVGTQGTMKGVTCEQLKDLNCQLILGNTYHLGMRPVSSASWPPSLARLGATMVHGAWYMVSATLSSASPRGFMGNALSSA